MESDDLIRMLDRQMKIRALQGFDEAEQSLQDLEREFALEALELMRSQPAMASAAGMAREALVERAEAIDHAPAWN